MLIGKHSGHFRLESRLLKPQGRIVILIGLLVVVPLTALMTAPPAHAGGPTPVCLTGTSPGVLSICIVLGQPDLTTLTAGQPSSPTAIGNPTAVAFDSKGDAWVADNSNNRVLEYEPPFSTGEAASLVIGQKSLTGTADSSPSGGLFGPTGIAFDSGGNLWVVDSGNNRVLEFKSPFSNGESASLVLGQPTFGGYIGTTTAGGLNSPSYLAFDPSGDLWVTDQGNNRVLEFTAPFSTGQKASVVIGQADFTSFAPSSTTTAKSLFEPLGIGFDSKGDLWVVDSAEHRVLEYTAPFSIDEAASIVIGQPSFTVASSSTGLNAYAIAFDSSGNLWISDGINGVAECVAPLSTGEAVSPMIGPKTLTGNGTLPGTKLSDPQGLTFDAGNNLWVADYGHGRVLEYGSGAPSSTTSSSSLSTTTSGTSGGGGVPEYPYQLAAATIFTLLVVGSYLLVRRRSAPRGRVIHEPRAT
jgi:sugar lactone lactonase YvrE